MSAEEPFTPKPTLLEGEGTWPPTRGSVLVTPVGMLPLTEKVIRKLGDAIVEAK